LQLILREILIQDNVGAVAMDIRDQMERQETRYLLQFSTIIIGTIPAMLLYPFIQRYFVKGIMVGAIKG
jgi:multiple sugar transport system permease protein/putative aldouronate transport system permease protein